ncbi:putative metal-dependent membrane protease [Gottschalkia purinilytica]|uniref:Putative metal-dependent membrane protease n=1 Tax=Gottschalkia purinilytica TaxID=1503 RepID=A0A0L0W9Y6_GOTPU|nr:type II CAAX endopeptidase family protein [Gottschalkia purinilytica]KNF08257.1 putative metal-dependent membrane protease [Gottschalkia purinilytica]
MEEVFRSIKLRRMVGVYILINIAVAIISTFPYFKKYKILDFSFWNLIINILLFIWICSKIIKNKVKLMPLIKNFKSNLKWKEIITILSSNMILSMGFSFVILYLVFLLAPNSIEGLLNDQSFYDEKSLSSIMFASISGTFIAPIIEEFMFRGVMLNRLSIRWSVASSIIASSILFGILHNSLGAIGAIVFGIMVSLIYLKYKNILIVMFIHFLNNLIVFSFEIITYFMKDQSRSADITNPEEFKSLGIMGIAIILISGFFTIRYIIKNWPKKIDTFRI